MAREIFGLNIAKIVDDAVQGAGGTGSVRLVKKRPIETVAEDIADSGDPMDLGFFTRDRSRKPAMPTEQIDKPAPIELRGHFKSREAVYNKDTLVRQEGKFITIFGNSIPAGVEIEPGDELWCGDRCWYVESLTSVDPAEAVYMYRVTGSPNRDDPKNAGNP